MEEIRRDVANFVASYLLQNKSLPTGKIDRNIIFRPTKEETYKMIIEHLTIEYTSEVKEILDDIFFDGYEDFVKEIDMSLKAKMSYIVDEGFGYWDENMLVFYTTEDADRMSMEFGV